MRWARDAPAPTSDPLVDLVDRVNESALAALAGVAAVPFIAGVLARGSFVQSRLDVAQFRWDLLRRRLRLDRCLEQLVSSCGESDVLAGLERFERHVVSKVLRHDDDLGPAKLLVRLRIPDERFWASVTKTDIKIVVGGMKRPSMTPATRRVFEESQLACPARERVKRAWLRLARRLHPATSSNGNFESLAAILATRRVLHPCIPVDVPTVQEVSARLDCPAEVARTAIETFHFCWLADVPSRDDLSDVSFKNFVVRPLGSPGTQTQLSELAAVFRHAIESTQSLRDFHVLHPFIRVTALTQVIEVPVGLFHTLAAQEGEELLSFLICNRLGHRYASRFLAGRTHADERVERSTLTALCKKIAKSEYKEMCFEHATAKRRVATDLGLSRARLTRWLEKAIRRADDTSILRYAEVLGRAGRDDYARNLRGTWMVRDSR